MKPIEFAESNRILVAENMSDLPVYSSDEMCISKWQLTFFERVSLLFRGTLWLLVKSGPTQPPVAFDMTASPFEATP